ncbi:MAG: hypothetical protein KF723_14925 [Rhizobiaceae bacterium]|nr:hypothetical protein [Rhizobiaceae bacterium]
MPYRIAQISLLLVTVAAGSPAGAQDMPSTFFVRDGGWTIMSGSRGCNAVNRDPVEFNVAPYNALWLTRYQGQDPHTVVRIFYWPGAFEDDKPVTIRLDVFGGKTIELEAMTTGSSIVDSSYPLTPENFEALDKAGTAYVRINGQPDLAFRTRGILDASQYLERCTATIKLQP